jgi:CheY-like chemotaxis protein
MHRSLLARVLRDEGYDVVEAADGTQGLELARRTPSVDMVITDNRMTGLSGPEFADKLRELYPALPILHLTGYNNVPGQDGRPTLYKPFNRSDLLRTVRALMDAPPLLLK